MSRSTKRSTRLHELHAYLAGRKRPVRINELAAHFGVHRSTVNRMFHDLRDELGVHVIQHSDRSVEIDRARSDFAIRLTLHESLAVFMAARLLARYADKPNPHIVTALGKIAMALDQTHTSLPIARHIARTSDRLDRPLSEDARAVLRNLETLTQAWADGVRVRLTQRESPDVERLFEPYYIEPSAIGYSSYVIGFDHLRHAIRTFKIERLARVTPTLDSYTIPASFDPLEKLALAWGVNWGDGETPIEVRLRFRAGRAADRVRETVWHESQQRHDLPDGSCEMRITVGSTLEMKPFIRQWGADCVVEAPETLRREIAEEMREAAQHYA
jgi:proteasome accessory factor B